MDFIIKKSLLNQILVLLTDKGYLKCPDYDISILFEEVGKFSCKIKRPTYSKREFIIKYPEKNKDRAFNNMLMEYLFNQYDFELKEWSDETGIPLLDTCILFSKSKIYIFYLTDFPVFREFIHFCSIYQVASII